MQMTIFGGMFLVGAGWLFFGSFFDHDADHDVDGADLDHDHDVGGADGQDGSLHDEPTMSIYSPKIISTFVMTFGAFGFIATYFGFGPILASASGMLGGFALAGTTYAGLNLLYQQQANSVVSTSSTVGQVGVVVVAIDANSLGKVDVSLGSKRLTCLARSSNGRAISQGRTVVVLANHGSELLVEESL
jgi:hypothetical protein